MVAYKNYEKSPKSALACSKPTMETLEQCEKFG